MSEASAWLRSRTTVLASSVHQIKVGQLGMFLTFLLLLIRFQNDDHQSKFCHRFWPLIFLYQNFQSQFDFTFFIFVALFTFPMCMNHKYDKIYVMISRAIFFARAIALHLLVRCFNFNPVTGQKYVTTSLWYYNYN